jgi:hypothetical protein
MIKQIHFCLILILQSSCLMSEGKGWREGPYNYLIHEKFCNLQNFMVSAEAIVAVAIVVAITRVAQLSLHLPRRRPLHRPRSLPLSKLKCQRWAKDKRRSMKNSCQIDKTCNITLIIII